MITDKEAREVAIKIKEYCSTRKTAAAAYSEVIALLTVCVLQTGALRQKHCPTWNAALPGKL